MYCVKTTRNPSKDSCISDLTAARSLRKARHTLSIFKQALVY